MFSLILERKFLLSDIGDIKSNIDAHPWLYKHINMYIYCVPLPIRGPSLIWKSIEKFLTRYHRLFGWQAYATQLQMHIFQRRSFTQMRKNIFSLQVGLKIANNPNVASLMSTTVWRQTWSFQCLTVSASACLVTDLVGNFTSENWHFFVHTHVCTVHVHNYVKYSHAV